MRISQVALAAFAAAFTVAPAMAAPRWDADGDGKMDRTEFAAMAMKRLLKNADKDGDGMISLEEWKARPAMAKAKGDVDRRFARLDRNGDGKLDSGELDAIFGKRFARIDADKDGFVTKEERKARRAASGPL